MSTLVSFLWHMHQPFYKDLARKKYVMPWAYLHATKDYFGMPALLEEFPHVHQTFNLVPSLILQIEEYARDEAHDESLDLAFRPVDALSQEERRFIVKNFFPVPVQTMILPFPRYAELHQHREQGGAFSDADIRDVQAWWTLAWLDHDHLPKELIEKGRDFTEADKAALRQIVLQTIRRVIPEYRRMRQAGSIEISTTPFYHPILPLLINSRVDDPNVPVDVRIPDDAHEQLLRSRNFMHERFGEYPTGLWPSEGSVSDVVARMASSASGWIPMDGYRRRYSCQVRRRSRLG